jgi:hypothetical protein
MNAVNRHYHFTPGGFIVCFNPNCRGLAGGLQIRFKDDATLK